jgi:putative flippase GtrA
VALTRRLLADQKVRFLIVGAVNTAVGYAVFALVYWFVLSDVRLGYLVSLAVSYAVAISLAFVLYRRFVFRVTGRVVRDFVAFVGVYAVAIGTNALLLPLLVEVLGVHPLLAQAVALVVTTLISYFGHREVSFRRPDEPAAPPA